MMSFSHIITSIPNVSVSQGFNSTIFAYGQTASGKTHTMLGTDSEPGVIWRSVNSIFDQIIEADDAGDRKFLIRCAYLEIYNEGLTDLLVEVRLQSSLLSVTLCIKFITG